MLSLLLMLISDPLTSPPPAAPPAPDIQLRTWGVDRCGPDRLQRIEQLSGPTGLLQNNLTVRQDGEVRRYLLLDRRVDGCPVPISYPLPDRQGGFIRELGPTGSAEWYPDRPEPRPQPPRSSE